MVDVATIIDDEPGSVTNGSGNLTHRKLCEVGKDWLLSTKRCNPVFVEKSGGEEIPDVIGWNNEACFVIECKTSIEDYRADQKKGHRFCGGLGVYRYYLVPAELADKIPNDTGWGLISVSFAGDFNAYVARQVRGRGSKTFERTLLNEVKYLQKRVMDIQRYGL